MIASSLRIARLLDPPGLIVDPRRPSPVQLGDLVSALSQVATEYRVRDEWLVEVLVRQLTTWLTAGEAAGTRDPDNLVAFARGSKRARRLEMEQRAAEKVRKAVVFYARLSRNRDGVLTGIDRQHDVVVPWARELKGWDVVLEASDDDTSAYHLRRPRPGFEEAMSWLRDGRADGLVAYDMTRICRRVREWPSVLPMDGPEEARRITAPWFVATFNGSVNTAEPMGLLIAQILVAIAEMESANISARTQSKHAELAREGKFSGGGTRAFGLTRDRKSVVPEEAAAIREAAELLLSGNSLVEVARRMELRGVVGVGKPRKDENGVTLRDDAGNPLHEAGRPMPASTWRKILVSPHLVGRRMDDGRLSTGAPAMAPILDDEIGRRVRALLGGNTSGSASTGTARRHLLTGLLECGLCHGWSPDPERRKAQRRQDHLGPWVSHGVPAYACKGGAKGDAKAGVKGAAPGQFGCGKLSIPLAKTDAAITEVVLQDLERTPLAERRPVTQDTGPLLARQQEIDASMRELTEARFVNRTLREPEWEHARDLLERERAEIDRQLRDFTPRPIAGGKDARVAWQAWTLAERRSAIEAVIERIVVLPGFVAAEPDARHLKRRLRPDERLEIHLRRP
jgi:DNA invertase Pin-like site-specific DNA recombinase